ncbi:hypothetical protein BIW11_13901 [Tropilaelaps mercedesae]|uniref:Uncharacterized protein n=1 Tax=Tropilaelaps mercedesae TaxID=418985 RepID=A0A1V9WZU8_9ACAR|nr:hypothetical protein BIW11_13901 [Tropilaelaps mercedesae]
MTSVGGQPNSQHRLAGNRLRCNEAHVEGRAQKRCYNPDEASENSDEVHHERRDRIGRRCSLDETENDAKYVRIAIKYSRPIAKSLTGPSDWWKVAEPNDGPAAEALLWTGLGEIDIRLWIGNSQWTRLAEWLQVAYDTRAALNLSFVGVYVNGRLWPSRRLTLDAAPSDLIVQFVITRLYLVGGIDVCELNIQNEIECASPLELLAFVAAVSLGSWAFARNGAQLHDESYRVERDVSPRRARRTLSWVSDVSLRLKRSNQAPVASLTRNLRDVVTLLWCVERIRSPMARRHVPLATCLLCLAVKWTLFLNGQTSWMHLEELRANLVWGLRRQILTCLKISRRRSRYAYKNGNTVCLLMTAEESVLNIAAEFLEESPHFRRHNLWRDLAKWLAAVYDVQRMNGAPLRGLHVNDRFYPARRLGPEAPASEVVIQLVIVRINLTGEMDVDELNLQGPIECADPLEFLAFVVRISLYAASYKDDVGNRLDRRSMLSADPEVAAWTGRRLLKWVYETTPWLVGKRQTETPLRTTNLKNVTVLLWCIGSTRGRLRRVYVPLAIVLFCNALSFVLRADRNAAWEYLEELLSNFTWGLRQQLVAYIQSYRRLGYFRSFESAHLSLRLPPIDDRLLKTCADLLNGLPRFLWDAPRTGLTARLAEETQDDADSRRVSGALL